MRFERAFASGRDSPAEARNALVDVADHLPPRRLEDAKLLVSELVTNAVHHAHLRAGDVITLVVETTEHALRVEVRDPGNGFRPAEPELDGGRVSGWGLYLVRELSDRWGVERSAPTRVWFELDRRTTR
jgi:anti-sigma regulatory factor (Ser/Thr protein kinase)